MANQNLEWEILPCGLATRIIARRSYASVVRRMDVEVTMVMNQKERIHWYQDGDVNGPD
jgi:hypothetical protein